MKFYLPQVLLILKIMALPKKKKKNLERKQIQIYTQSGKFSLAKSQRSISTTAALSLSRDFGKKKNIQI